MSDHEDAAKKPGFIYAVGAVLGVGLGAAAGVAMDNVNQGLWIGGMIGVGLAMLVSFIRRKD